MQLLTHCFTAMGGPCTLHLYAPSKAQAEAAASLAEDEVQRIARRYSRYRDDSELARINRVAASGGSVTVDAETAALLDYAAACYAKSDGLFDITAGVLREAWDFSGTNPAPLSLLAQAEKIAALLPRVGWRQVQWQAPQLRFSRPGMALDLGGIGKEYAADQAAAVCRAAGITHGLVDLAGDLHAIGPLPDGTPWQVLIRHPGRPDKALAQAALLRGGLATSGDYERFVEIDGQRYSHLLDPRSGWPVRGAATVSVMADNCLLAGSIATLAMLRGAAGRAWLAERAVAGLWATAEGVCDCRPPYVRLGE